MSEDFNPYLRSAIWEVVEKQLASNTPPKTRQTYGRLLYEGRSKNDSKELIARVVVAEIFEILSLREPSNHERLHRR